MFLCRCHCYFLILLLSEAVSSASSTTNVSDDSNSLEWVAANNLTLVGNYTSEPVALEHKKESGAHIQSDSRKKVDEFGEILKKKVEMLQVQDNKKLDIVFLVDASSSVGDENFKSELKFVKKLLADFSISVNETRAAVITFSDADKVVRHVDHISVPSEENHKCNMLHRDLPNIKYSGGLTYTLGALIEAQSILEWSRDGAQKAVFLITDGFSNGGDPIPVAQFLRDNRTYIFTFGIQSGNIVELEFISSYPAREFSYILDSFDQFEAVVRRALHQDLSLGSYQILNDVSHCDLLCSDTEKGRKGCCDLEAHCSCGTGSGHYRCLCNPGYYGSGLKDSCKPCPNGTYHDGLVPGDESVCSSCPDPNHFTVMGSASSKASCICKSGFVARGDFCEGIRCPTIHPPEHGYFVKGGMCLTVFNAACGVRCNAGYTLHGSSIRLCQGNGTWSGKAPKCIVKMCPNPEIPLNGGVECSLKPSLPNDLLDPIIEDTKALLLQYAVDTECRFTCKPGNVLVGSRRRICLPLARWDGLRSVCKPITCRPLPKLIHGLVTPSLCTENAKIPHGQKCNFSCGNGYKLVGPVSRKCGGKGGQWSMKSNASKCIDEQPPTITCPANIITETDSGEAYATVIVPQPTVYDNSGKTPIVWSQPSVTSLMKIPIGILQINFVAMDPSRNQAACNVTITVLDKEPPITESCISPKRVHVLETGGNRSVSWMKPEFYDNSNQELNVTASHSFGEFPVGRTEVRVVATDQSGNNSTCVLEVVVEDSLCSRQLPESPHASITCDVNENLSFECSMTCEEGFAFDTNRFENEKLLSLSNNGSLLYTCPAVIDEASPVVEMSSLPQCGETVLPNSVSQEGEMMFIASQGTCEDTDLISKVKNIVELELSKRSEDFCNKTNNLICHILNTNASCEEIASLEEEETNSIHRSKRSFSQGAMLLQEPHSTQRSRGKTTSSSHININFHVVSQLQNNKAGAKYQKMNGFSQLKDSLGRATFSLPKNVSQQTFHWNGKEAVVCTNETVFHNSGICVKCSPGSFFANFSRKCLPCPLGTYQILGGQSNCKSCPKHMSTKYEGSWRVQDCLYLCQPGSYGHVIKSKPDIIQTELSVLPCSLCDPGLYQPNYGATSCLPCPAGPHSYKKGAKSVKDCFKLYGKTNWSTPSKCPSHLCQNGGSCRLIQLGFLSCECQPGYYGSVCELTIDDCSSSPCLNGGECSEKNPHGYECRCHPGFYGRNCEEEIDECNPNPCLNNSTCEDLSNGYFCDCQDGFSGLMCEENINECSNDPCGEHGLCVDGVSNYLCSCIDGYSGTHCEIEPDDPCFKNDPCLNSGSCVSLNSTAYRCICAIGWEGKHCEREHDSCSSAPCLNNGTCTTKSGGSYICSCTALFAGDICQTRLQSNFVLFMHAASVTDYSVIDFPSQNLTKMTACLWLQSKDGLNYGTAFSYATKNQFNSLILTDYNGFVLYVNGNRVITDVSANDGLWHHVCVFWQSHHGMWSIYLDGILRDNGTGLSPNQSVIGGGKFVLGQEQDSFGSTFSEAESFIGRIYRLDVWDDILTPTNITSLAKECLQSMDGSIVKWSDFLSKLRGNIKVENSTFCSECPSLAPLWYGTVTLIKENNETIASYDCENGFVMHRSKVTTAKRRCLKQGSWEGDPPVCVRLSCGFPGYLPGGTFIGRSFLYTDAVRYECHFGAQIVGNATRVCQADGKWSGEPPICKGRECPPLTAPKHGSMVIGKTASSIQTATFSCDTGFHLDGLQILTCMHDGLWDEIVPECAHNLCPAPPKIAHAFHKNSSTVSFVYMDKIYYECEVGYEMLSTSSAIIQCSESGKWCPQSTASVLMPKCELKHCSDPDFLEHGSWVLKHGQLNDTSHYYSIGSVLTALCEPNYEVIGPKTKQCKDKSWRPLDVTQCTKKTCATDDLPFDLPHSVLHISGEEIGDSATLSCKTGFQLSYAKGVTEIVHDVSSEPVPEHLLVWLCESDGSWVMNSTNILVSTAEGEWLACLPERLKNVNCSPPEAPAFGYVLSDTVGVDYAVGTTVEVQCRPGFWLDGSSTIICDKNGTWLGSYVCKPVKCRSLPHFSNMVIASSTAIGQDMEFGNMLTFRCKHGFQRSGILSVRCQQDGNWSPMRGKCVFN